MHENALSQLQIFIYNTITYPGFNPKVSSESLRKIKIAVTYTAVKKIFVGFYVSFGVIFVCGFGARLQLVG